MASAAILDFQKFEILAVFLLFTFAGKLKSDLV